MVQQGIIDPLGDKPTDLCHPVVVVAKQKGGVRICVDLITELNKQIKRSIYPISTPKDAVANTELKSIFFTTVDAKHGYWQLPLDEVLQDLTTFITPCGRYKFLRAPMGLSSTAGRRILQMT